jgi:hypothetical protein
VLAVVSGADELSDVVGAGLGGAVSVVTEPRRGPLATAFAVSGFPMFYLINADGQVVTRSLSVGGLGQFAGRRPGPAAARQHVPNA